MSIHDIEDRLARLAPLDTPDPSGFAAARARVDAAVRRDATSVSASAPGRPGPAHPQAGTLQGEQPHRFSPDVVVPLTPRARRRRALLVAASGIAVVGVLALVPGRVVLEQRELAATQAAIDQCRSGDGSHLRLVTAERIDDEILALLEDPADPDHVEFCSRNIGTNEGGAIGFTADDGWAPVDGPGDVTFEATGSSLADDGPDVPDVPDGAVYAVALWGHAGDDVASARLTTASGELVEAAVTEGYWVAMFVSADGTDGSFEDASLTWRSVDGSTQTSTLDDLSPDE